MHKRLIILILAALLLVSAFAACTSPSPSATPTAPPATGEEQTPPPPEERDVMTISVYADGWAPDMKWDIDNDPYAKLILDKFQVIIKPEFAEGEDAIALMAAGGTLPEVFMNNFVWNLPRYTSFAIDGVVRLIPYSIVDKYPRVKELLDINGLYTKAFAEVQGVYDGVYHIPKPVSYIEGEKDFYYATGWHAIYYRQDWAKKLNIAKPTTLDEYYDMLKKFKTEDPNGNGQADEYGLSSPNVWPLYGNTIFSAFDLGADGETWMFNDETKKWELGVFRTNYADMLEWYQNMDNEGILDPEFPLLTWNTVMQKFASETIGAFPRNADTWWVYNTIYNQIGSALKWTPEQALENIGNICTLKKDASDTPKTYAYSNIMGGGGTQFRANVTDETLERYLEVHNWLLSEEAKLWGAFGEEDTHWKWNDDKTKVVTFTDPETGSPFVARNYIPAITLSSMTSWNMDVSGGLQYPAPPPESYKLRSAEMRAEWLQYNVPLKNNPVTQVIYLPEEATLALDQDATFVLIIQGDKPAREAHTEWVSKMMAAGADQVIEKFNQKMTELGIDPRGVGMPAN